MKCPKCGYMSFDFNQICPRCSREISVEREKMNLPSFRPAPPSLLGTLTGETSDSHIGFNVDGSGVYTTTGEQEPFSPEDSQTMEAMEEAFEDSQSLEEQIEAEPNGELHAATEESDEALSSDLEDLVIDISDVPAIEAKQEAGDDDLFPDFDDPSVDETEIVFEENITDEAEDDEKFSLELDPIELDIEPETASLDLAESSDEEEFTDLDENTTEAGEDEFSIVVEELNSDDALETVESKDAIDSLDLEDLELDLELDQPNGKPA